MKNILLLTIGFIMLHSCSAPKRSIVHKRPNYKKPSTYTSVKNHKKTNRHTLRDEVLISALKYVGKPYKYGGKTPNTGFDCSGLVSYVFLKSGIDVSGASHHQSKLGSYKRISELEPGDLVFFGDNNRVSHVSIVYRVKNNQVEVIHSTSSRGVRIDEIAHSPYWRKMFLFGRDVLTGSDYVISR